MQTNFGFRFRISSSLPFQRGFQHLGQDPDQPALSLWNLLRTVVYSADHGYSESPARYPESNSHFRVGYPISSSLAARHLEIDSPLSRFKMAPKRRSNPGLSLTLGRSIPKPLRLLGERFITVQASVLLQHEKSGSTAFAVDPP